MLSRGRVFGKTKEAAVETDNPPDFKYRLSEVNRVLSSSQSIFLRVYSMPTSLLSLHWQIMASGVCSIACLYLGRPTIGRMHRNVVFHCALTEDIWQFAAILMTCLANKFAGSWPRVLAQSCLQLMIRSRAFKKSSFPDFRSIACFGRGENRRDYQQMETDVAVDLSGH